MLPYVYRATPTPHIYLPQLLPPELFRKAKFPTDIPIRAAGRSGRDLFIGERGFADAVGAEGLGELYRLFTGADFVKWVISVFEKDLIRLHCRVSPRDVKVVDFLETREALDEWPETLPGNHDVNELFNRFDFTIGGSDYTDYVHLDSSRRIVGGLLFFSDAAKDGIEGGEFTLYRDLLFNNDRKAHWPVAAKKFRVAENTGILFLNSNTGFHGPARIRSIEGTRRWVYYSISSRIQVWQPGKSALIARAANGVLRRLGMAGYFRKPSEPRSKVEANQQEASRNL